MRSLTALCLALFALPAAALEIEVLTSADPGLAMAPVAAPDGRTHRYTLGVGSGAFRHPGDGANVLWTVGDRGPNMTCAEAVRLLGPYTKEACDKVRAGRYYPTPAYAPSIYRLELDRAAKTFRLAETLPLRTRSGKLLTGLLNPQTRASKDTALDLTGRVLADDPDNIDLEAVVRLSDGTFWISEEMGPSIAEVSADGRMLRRFVPADQATDYVGSEATIIASLPAILSKRQGNRGFESLAISPDERFLYFVMQNPLANPDARAYQQSKNARLFKFDRVEGRLVGEYIYQLDDPGSFALDPSTNQSDPRLSELTALGPDRLLVLERTEKTTKLYEVTLAGATDILGTRWDDPATAPSLELSNAVAPLGLTPLAKTLRFDTARDYPGAPEKIEGVAFLGDGAMAIINDNDFGIRGDDTKILIVHGAVTADPSVYRR